MAATIPNQDILIGTPTLQEAGVNPATENIVTTRDDLGREDGPADAAGTAIREVLRHRHALRARFEQVRRAGLPTLDSIHPFGDGTGRIVNALYLAKEALLEIPVPLQRDASPGRPGRATIPDTARATLVR
ncbi:Fic/DOC family N-terminal domain-containing protein [Coralloluteibacterium thermophilus]|uniref:Fic/DOC family N-terminal domain-containing protein n=1 Tax=Coralloluteibacterium thermophilum TaxID=2707049 RepID=A0ABV9NIN3_9GAMM